MATASDKAYQLLAHGWWFSMCMLTVLFFYWLLSYLSYDFVSSTLLMMNLNYKMKYITNLGYLYV